MPTVSLPLSRMSATEKLGTMERIWDSLRQQEDKVPSPAWHLEILAARKAAVASGKSKFMDWGDAKAAIRRKVRS